MSKTAGAAPAPVFEKSLRQRMILQSEFRRLDAELQDFNRTRERLVATGHDPNAAYREILSERDKIGSQLRKVKPSGVPNAGVVSGGPPPGASLLTLPIAPATFGSGLGVHPWFGYAGSVQMGPAQPGDFDVPHFGNYSGNPYTLHIDYAGGVQYTGDCSSTDLPSNVSDDYPPFLWLLSWRYLLPFPPPMARSIFTYSFDVDARAVVGVMKGSGNLTAYLLIGEAANYQGQQISLTSDAEKIIVWDVQPTDLTLKGTVHVQRSFWVDAGQFPAVEIVLGIDVNLGPHTNLTFDNAGDCYFSPSSHGVVGRVDFRYDPNIVVHP